MLLSCSSTKEITDAERVQIDELETLIDSKVLAFEANWAYPLVSSGLTQLSNAGLLGNGNNAGSINLQNNSNYVRIINDRISASLPYYGERRVGGGYNSDSGIVLDGPITNYTVTKDTKKGSTTMKFRASNKTEVYDFVMTVFPNRKTNIIVNSTQRTSIRYSGAISEWEGSDVQ